MRGTLPRLRMDQLMNLAWKFMLPMALVVILAAGLWRFLPEQELAALARLRRRRRRDPCVLLARMLRRRQSGLPRETYRYAD